MGTYYIGKKETAPQIWKDEPYRRKLYCLISPELDPSNQDIACGLVDLPEGSQSDFRGHEEGELFFCISGKGHIRLGDEVLPLEANSAIYVPPLRGASDHQRRRCRRTPVVLCPDTSVRRGPADH